MKRIITLLILMLAVLSLAACSPAVETPAEVDEVPQETAYPVPPMAGIFPTITPYYPVPAESGGDASGVKPIYNYKPTTSDENLVRGEVFLNLEESQVLILESMPVQINLLLRGDLPTPCHELRVILLTDEANKRIDLEVYTLVGKTTVCIDVLQPFEATISLGSFSGGSYTIYANGEELGSFDS